MPRLFLPTLFTPCKSYTKLWNENIVLLTDRNNPGNDIYFFSRWAPDTMKVLYTDAAPEVIPGNIKAGDFVVINRLVPASYLKALQAVSHHLSGVAWFIDDDIPAAWQNKHLPNGYGRRMSWSYIKSRKLLARLCDRIWVSTAWLAHKYDLPETCILTPGFKEISAPASLIRYFYHVTKSHLREMQFLRPVVEAIQNKYDYTRFEVVGDHDVYKLFRDIPGTEILHPMKWEKFRQYTASARFDIGFAPVLDSLFNKARSHNKLLDISRCGAVGIYSEGHSNAELIAKNNAGFVVSNEPHCWVQAFEQLLTVDREEMSGNARQLITALQHQSDLKQMVLINP